MAAALLAGLNGWSQCSPAIAGVSNITSASAKINWNAVPAYPGATYTLEVHKNSTFTDLFGSYPTVAATSYALTGLTNNTTYYFRVKTNDAACTDYATGSFVAQVGLTPLDVTGFNHDVIANGVGVASGSTTNSVDSNTSPSANFAYLSKDYKLNAGDATSAYGLPINRSLTSPNVTGLNYILQDYSSSNSLRLSATNDFGSLTLTQQAALSNIYLAVASGDGSSTFNAEIQFSDGATQTVTALSATNWDDSAPAASPAIIAGIGRVKRGTGVAEGPGNFKLFQLTLNVDLINQTKLVNAIKFTKTVANATESKVPNIFAVSGKLTPSCPAVASPSAAATTLTSATISWTLATLGTSAATGATATYTVEVYTDSEYTTPITGSPFTGITALNKVVTGLALNTTYYYRIKANNGTCDGDYTTNTYSHAYCAATVTTANSNIITNFTTTAGYQNIANTSTNAAYADFTAQVVSKAAGATFNFTGIKSVTTTRVTIYVDWNQDLDFADTGETVYTLGTNSNTTFTGTITIPAGTPLGNYRMRVRSSSSASIIACGNVLNGDTEDYTVTVAAPPAPCVAPAAPTLAVSNFTTTGMSVTATSGTAPTGYVLIRSTEATLSAPLVNVTEYTPGTSVGNGIVVAVGPTISGFVDFAAPNTRYYYHAFAYNNGGATCLGPIYSTTPGTANGLTCAKAVVNASASNITSTSALLNWSSVVGNGGAAATYTIEIYTDAALTTMLGAARTSTTASYALTGLTNGVTYYYRVKTQTAACFTDTWSATSSFVAENNYTPFTVAGFNEDVIANGTGIAKASTTNAVDAVNNSYQAVDYERAAGVTTTLGLPVNRTQSPASLAALKFLFADYSGNNALRLPAINQAGTLTLSNPRRLTNVYLAVTSGSGASDVTAKINFLDGTSQTPVSAINLLDWYGSLTNAAQPPLIAGIARVNRSDNNGAVDTGSTASRVFYVTIPVLVENQTKAVASIEITKTSAGLTEPVPNIFAVSGKQIDECPVLATATTVPAGNNATVNWTLATGSAAATSYTVEVFSNPALTTAVTGSPFTVTTGLTYNVTGLSPLTTYYFRVRATNAICSSASIGGNFTTTCLAPAAPTAAATQTVCGPATIASLSATAVSGATLNWYLVSGGGTAQATTAPVATGTYYVSQTLNACESARTAVAVTVNTVAAPTAAAQTVCTGTTFSQLVVTGATGATFTWSATQGGAAITGSTAVTPGTFFVTQTVNGCISPATSVVLGTTTVTAPIAAAQTHCTGITFAQLNATGATGATFTWSATQGGAAIAGTTVVTGGTYYVTQTVGTCTSTATSVAVTINTTPVPTAATQTKCIGTTVADLTATGVTGGTFTWSSSQGGTALATTTVLASGTYFVTQTLNGCASTPVPVTVVINSTPAPTAAATQPFCIGATVSSLSATTATGATVKWSTTEGGAALASTEVLASGTYYVTQTLNACESTATPVSVVVNSTAAPEASATQYFCIGETAAQLSATTLPGAVVVWSATQGGAAIDDTTVLASGTYYVTQTLNDCTSIATAVTVVVNSTPAPVALDQALCVGSTVNNLIAANATGATVKWYTTQGGVALDASTVLISGTYYVTQTLNLCESTATEIEVTINTVVPPTANAQTYCAGTTASELTATAAAGATLTWYATEGGQAIGETTILVSGTYFVTQTIGDCTSTATSVLVTINDVPNAPTGSATQTFENGDTLADLTITTVTGATVQWYTLEGDVYTAVNANTVLEDNTTYYVTQTTTTCESDYLAVTVSAVSGRDGFKFSNLTVYPNPTKDIVSVTNSAIISNVKVVNLLGQTVIEKNANNNTVQIDLSGIAAGTYILQVNADGASTSVKVIKH